MKVIIAGSRDITDKELVYKVIEQSGFDITEIVCGMCKGVDSLGELYAKENNINIKYYPADWDKHGRAAGPIRNKNMASRADALILIHHNSKGSLSMLRLAKKYGLKIYEHNI